MRKSKFDQSPLPVQDSKYMNQDDNISEIENRVEFDTEFVNLTNQIEDIKAAIQKLEQIKACVDSSMEALEKSTQTLNAAIKKSDNIANAICRTFIQVENTVITIKLSETDKSILAEYRHKLIEEEKCLFEKQMAELKATHEKHWKEVNRFAKSYTSFSLNEGGNLAASKIRNLECPNYEICLIDYGCGKFNRKIHIMEQYP